MRPTLAAVGIVVFAAASAAAGDLEVGVQAGASLPFYSQSFSVDPATLLPAGFPARTSGTFSLDASGGLAIAGSATWYFAKSVGVEVRVDSAAVSLELTGGEITAGTGVLPPPLGLSAHITGETQIDRLTAFSLDLRLRSPGRVRVFVSGGISFLPASSATATARIQGELRLLPGLPALPLPGVGVSASGTIASAVGGNVGAGVEIPLAPRVALAVEGRGFAFPTRELQWGPANGGVSPIEAALAAALEPIQFRPGFFQLTGGLTVRF